jgi:hypothetical protein
LRRGHFQEIEGDADLREQRLPGFSEDNASVQTAKERAAEIRFQFSDLVADGAVRNVQLLRSVGEAQMAGGGLKSSYRR